MITAPKNETENPARSDPAEPQPCVSALINPRLGDIEDDIASTKSRSLVAIGGRLLGEISLPKLFVASAMLIGLPAILLGLAPLVLLGWGATMSGKFATGFAGMWSVLIAVGLIALAWFGGKPLLRGAEQSFWSLNALAVQPVYALFREGLRHFVARLIPSAGPRRRVRLYAAAAVGGGLLVSALFFWLVQLAWPASRWIGEAGDVMAPHRLIIPALANAVVIMGCYVMGAALVWMLADGAMGRPADLMDFAAMPPGARTWRVAHLSDLHAVGERYGFRIESGRTGPQGNDSLRRVFKRLEALHGERPLDLILITGDMTDAGRSAEWAEFLDIVAAHPHLAERMLALPGNHDLNVVDRANPARLELPTSTGKRLRQMRTLSAIAALHGDKTLCYSPETDQFRPTFSERLLPYRDAIDAFADTGGIRLSLRLAKVWNEAFPMIIPPRTDDGLGVVLLNSNAEAHFSFTNALGMVSALQVQGLKAALRQFPRAGWIVALHHHLVEYPTPAKAFSERIGTALINGSWFVRQLRPLAGRLVVFHGHRHTDWIGQCGGVRIVSAPSPVMGPVKDGSVSFLVHTLAIDGEELLLAAPERIDVELATEQSRGEGCLQ
jgi:hypothetical protein